MDKLRSYLLSFFVLLVFLAIIWFSLVISEEQNLSYSEDPKDWVEKEREVKVIDIDEVTWGTAREESDGTLMLNINNM